MPKYANTSGLSNVVSWEEIEGGIAVTFGDGSTYEYTAGSCGQAAVDTLITLARAGRGLNGWINRHVRKKYARKR